MMLLIPEIVLFSKCSFSILENPQNFRRSENTDEEGKGREKNTGEQREDNEYWVIGIRDLFSLGGGGTHSFGMF